MLPCFVPVSLIDLIASMNTVRVEGLQIEETIGIGKQDAPLFCYPDQDLCNELFRKTPVMCLSTTLFANHKYILAGTNNNTIVVLSSPNKPVLILQKGPRSEMHYNPRRASIIDIVAIKNDIYALSNNNHIYIWTWISNLLHGGGTSLILKKIYNGFPMTYRRHHAFPYLLPLYDHYFLLVGECIVKIIDTTSSRSTPVLNSYKGQPNKRPLTDICTWNKDDKCIVVLRYAGEGHINLYTFNTGEKSLSLINVGRLSSFVQVGFSPKYLGSKGLSCIGN